MTFRRWHVYAPYSDEDMYVIPGLVVGRYWTMRGAYRAVRKSGETRIVMQVKR